MSVRCGFCVGLIVLLSLLGAGVAWAAPASVSVECAGDPGSMVCEGWIWEPTEEASALGTPIVLGLVALFVGFYITDRFVSGGGG